MERLTEKHYLAEDHCMNCVQEGCPCTGCFDSSRWEWRGLPDAPEGGE